MDVEGVLVEISPDAPSGENLEYDDDFGALARSAEGKPERQMGDKIIAAEAPDWPAVRDQSIALLERTKDLRVALHLVRALVHTEGYAGLRDGLAVVRGLLERYWPTVHPQLDADDQFDPTARTNVLAGLCDEETVLRAVRDAPVVSSRALGKFTLRQIQLTRGTHTPPEGSDDIAPSRTAVDAAFADSSLEALEATAGAVSGAKEHIEAIESYLDEVLRPGEAPSLELLGALVGETGSVVSDELSRRGGAATGTSEAGGEPDRGRGESIGTQVGGLSSRRDVVCALDGIMAYYQQHEPSSPVPLLMARAKRLVSMGFAEIVQDLAPDGMTQVEAVCGIRADGSAETHQADGD